MNPTARLFVPLCLWFCKNNRHCEIGQKVKTVLELLSNKMKSTESVTVKSLSQALRLILWHRVHATSNTTVKQLLSVFTTAQQMVWAWSRSNEQLYLTRRLTQCSSSKRRFAPHSWLYMFSKSKTQKRENSQLLFRKYGSIFLNSICSSLLLKSCHTPCTESNA